MPCLCYRGIKIFIIYLMKVIKKSNNRFVISTLIFFFASFRKEIRISLIVVKCYLIGGLMLFAFSVFRLISYPGSQQ